MAFIDLVEQFMDTIQESPELQEAIVPFTSSTLLYSLLQLLPSTYSESSHPHGFVDILRVLIKVIIKNKKKKQHKKKTWRNVILVLRRLQSVYLLLHPPHKKEKTLLRSAMNWISNRFSILSSDTETE